MTWQIDASHTHIQFTVRHMMISKVRGSFDSYEGSVEFNEDYPEQTKVHVKIAADSINTRDEQRDNHLRSPDFLNAAEYPYLIFESKRVEQTNDKKGRLIGDLTIRNVTNEVVLDVEYIGQAKSPWGTTSAGFTGSTTINRKDWGLTWNQALETGGVLVGDQVRIDVEMEIVKQPEQEAEAAATA